MDGDMPKKDSNFTKTNPSRKLDRTAPKASNFIICLGEKFTTFLNTASPNLHFPS